MRLLQKSTVAQSCLQDCPDFADRMKRKALRVSSEAHIPPYVTEAESRKQHSDSPLCNSLLISIAHKAQYQLSAPPISHVAMRPAYSFPKTFQPWKKSFPPLESLFSTLGKLVFLRRKLFIPPLEPKSSSLGTKKFQEGNCFWNSYV